MKEKSRKSFKYIIILISILLLSSMGVRYHKHLIGRNLKAFKIPSSSNSPTIIKGDFILVEKNPVSKSPLRGDFIVFPNPENPKVDFIKRVVAVGGDVVEVRNKNFILNSRKIKENYITHCDPKIYKKELNPRDNFGPVTIPENRYFVLGDNRDNSFDSRFFGSIEKSNIKGIAKNIYWSWDQESNSVRWKRIGKKIR